MLNGDINKRDIGVELLVGGPLGMGYTKVTRSSAKVCVQPREWQYDHGRVLRVEHFCQKEGHEGLADATGEDCKNVILSCVHLGDQLGLFRAAKACRVVAEECTQLYEKAGMNVDGGLLSQGLGWTSGRRLAEVQWCDLGQRVRYRGLGCRLLSHSPRIDYRVGEMDDISL